MSAGAESVPRPEVHLSLFLLLAACAGPGPTPEADETPAPAMLPTPPAPEPAAPAPEPVTPAPNSTETAPVIDMTIVPGERFGPVRRGMSRAQIAAQFPEISLVDIDVSVGEGFTEPGVVVPLDEARQFTVRFASEARESATGVLHIGEAWTFRGVGVGSDLDALHRSLGEPFEFSGFAWDYSGYVHLPTSAWAEYQGGIWINVDAAHREVPLYGELIGDRRLISSTEEGIETLGLHLSTMRVHFRSPQ